MTYQVVMNSGYGRDKIVSFDYKPNAQDFAVKEANNAKFGTTFEVVNEKTGLLMGTAGRTGPGTAVEYIPTVKPVRRDIL
jgi:hypothetical protein